MAMGFRVLSLLCLVCLCSASLWADEGGRPAVKADAPFVRPMNKAIGPPIIYVSGRKSLELMGPTLLVDARLCLALGVKKVRRALRLKRGKGWTTTLLAPRKLAAAGVTGLQRNDVIRFDYAGRGRLLIRNARFGNKPRSVKLMGLNQKKQDKLIEAP